MVLGPGFACRSDSEGVWVWSDRQHHFLAGLVFCDLSPHLGELLTAGQRIRLLAGRWSSAEVVEALLKLSYLGVLVVTPQARLSGRGVELVGASPSLRALLEQNFASLDLWLTSQEPELRVFFCHDYLSEGLDCLPKATPPTLLVRSCGRTLGLGPLLAGKESCLACLRHRFSLRYPHRLLLGPVEVPEPLRQDEQWVASRVASLCVEILTGSVGRYARELLQVDLGSGESTWHVVPRRRDCPECGEPGPGAFPTEVRKIALDHQHRSQSAEAFAERLEPELGPLLGLIETFHFSQEGPVYFSSARHVSPHQPQSLTALRSRTPLYASGKGKTAQQCRASCLGEAIERYALYCPDPTSDYLETFRNLGSQAIHPNKVMLYSESQYERRDPQAVRGPLFVPQAFDEEAKVAWRKVWSYSSQSWKLLPRELLRVSPDLRFCNPCSNGVAAGATREEALLQGLLELVERDSAALWWYPRRICPGVDLRGWDPPFVQALRHYYAGLARDFWLLDLTGDLELPAFAAISVSLKGPPSTVVGFGCHWDVHTAASRALTEMNQLLPYFLSKAERVGRKGPAAQTGLSSYDLKVEDNSYLLPCASTAPLLLVEQAPVDFPDTLSAFEACHRRLEQLGLELLYFDMTPSDVDISVARVLVPGLRHHWPRLAPGRLYHSGLAEGELNPVLLAT